jgi:nucleoside-diphosphate-sugar epimerase
LDVRDAAVALHLLCECGESGATYNVGSGEETSINALLTTALDLTGLAGSIEVGTSEIRPFDIPRHFADIARLRALGFQPRFSLERSIKDLLRYYSETVARRADCRAACAAATEAGPFHLR